MALIRSAVGVVVSMVDMQICEKVSGEDEDEGVGERGGEVPWPSEKEACCLPMLGVCPAQQLPIT